MAPAHVLVPLDGSPLAAEALAYALETFESRVTVLNVVTPLDASMSESGVLATDSERRAAARERAEAVVADATAAAPGDDRDVETVVETGDPADVILEYLADAAVDQVVMGGHGGDRSTLDRLLGTVATTVVAEAPVTVTVLTSSHG